jgi:hypothetical protein
VQFCLDFRTFFIVEYLLKSGLHCKKMFAKSSYHVSLADGGTTSVQMMGEFLFKF